ncbi:hypothetical protein B1B04_17315 [Lysinibacillus sp. KCTC 33748]|nr:hypothetical protein B1B04_17315 [Lysinibacillus sp. KCTC 33748]
MEWRLDVTRKLCSVAKAKRQLQSAQLERKSITRYGDDLNIIVKKDELFVLSTDRYEQFVKQNLNISKGVLK